MKNKHLAIILVVECLLTIVLTVGILNIINNEPTSQTHLPLYEEITAIKDKLLINITQTGHTNPVPECNFYELREEDSEDYFQTTVNYWVFQNGQQEHGDIEAFVEIYNKPNNFTSFIVEIARNSGDELTVEYNGTPICIFPTVTENDVMKPGYITFEVES